MSFCTIKITRVMSWQINEFSPSLILLNESQGRNKIFFGPI